LLKCQTREKSPHKTSNLKRYSPKIKSSYLDWYFCDNQANEYPIRDVTTRRKPEPHYEDKSFNKYASCNQRYLNKALKDGVSHIFFFTRYMGNDKKYRMYRKKYFITGFFEIDKTFLVHEPKKPIRKAVKASRLKFLKISDAKELSTILGGKIHNGRYPPKRLDEKDTKKILKHFSKKKDQTKKYSSFTRSKTKLNI